MRKNWIKAILAAAVLLFAGSSVALKAQTDGTYVGYSPYSVFGIGLEQPQGTAWSMGMGGVGIATRNKRFVNILNPAAVTARDSLSFMTDFGISGRESFFTEGQKHGFNSSFNLSNFVISFPLWKNTAMYAGINPFSSVGYKISFFEYDEEAISRTFTSQGNGGLYQVFMGGAVTLWDRFSIGAQAGYVFGSINKASSIDSASSSHQDSYSGDSLQVRNVNLKFGLQYEQPLGAKHALTLGATYRLSTPLSGYRIYYREIGEYNRSRDDYLISGDNISLGSQLGLGVSFRNSDIWSAELDFAYSNYSASGFENVPGFRSENETSVFSSSAASSIRAGFEITPGRNDIRYYLRRCTYRAGAYFDQSYFTVNGKHVNSVGITLGITLPVFRWYNGITLGLDFGQRGLDTAQLRENYLGFSMSLNMFDIWFRKPRYE